MPTDFQSNRMHTVRFGQPKSSKDVELRTVCDKHNVFNACVALALLLLSVTHPEFLQLLLQRDLVGVVNGSASTPLYVVLRLLLYQPDALQHIGDVIDAPLLYLYVDVHANRWLWTLKLQQCAYQAIPPQITCMTWHRR